MNDKEKCEILKSISIYDVFRMFLENEEIDNDIDKEETQQKEIFYTAKDLIEKYPKFFSTYKIRQYISKDELPYIKDGKERIFLKSQIDEWIKKKSTEAMFKGM